MQIPAQPSLQIGFNGISKFTWLRIEGTGSSMLPFDIN